MTNVTTDVRFTGVGSPVHDAQGKFQTEITIDGHRFLILVRVATDHLSQQRLLIGADFLTPRVFTSRYGQIYFDKENNDENPPEILQIDLLNEVATKVDLSNR